MQFVIFLPIYHFIHSLTDPSDLVAGPLVYRFTDALTAKANNMTGFSIFETYDHIMFMVPPGLMTGIANAVVFGKRSFYLGIWGLTVGVQMHEIGHNLGLYHSAYDGRQYADITGQMGYATTSHHEKMSKCFNAAHT